MIEGTSRAPRRGVRVWLSVASVALAVLLLAGNGAGGLHVVLFLLGAAAFILTDADYRIFLAVGIAGLIVSGVLLAAGVATPAQKLGDVTFLALAEGTLLAVFSPKGSS